MDDVSDQLLAALIAAAVVGPEDPRQAAREVVGCLHDASVRTLWRASVAAVGITARAMIAANPGGQFTGVTFAAPDAGGTGLRTVEPENVPGPVLLVARMIAAVAVDDMEAATALWDGWVGEDRQRAREALAAAAFSAAQMTASIPCTCGQCRRGRS